MPAGFRLNLFVQSAFVVAHVIYWIISYLNGEKEDYSQFKRSHCAVSIVNQYLININTPD